MIHSLGIPIASNQVSFSLIDRRAAGRMADFCVEHDVKILAYGTLAGGFLTEKYLEAKEPSIDSLPSWSLKKYKRFIDEFGGWQLFQDLLQVLNKIAAKHEVSIANVATRYVLEQPAVGCVLVGAHMGGSNHLADNKKILDFALDKDDHSSLEKVLARSSTIRGDCGDEYRVPPYLTSTGDLSQHL
eukprot:TRINITY_DN12716_c0_g1_i3.p1 TRINITY_DN12716_c0_g1~~TRINITY_DN12716_c0_g1_i3.p1  ORF type:complete len:186 (-),score=46.49 TRINITY_DN12716_c0_g1_i3:469-1026(-)